MNERKALALDIVQPEFGVGIPAFVDAMPSLTVWTSDDPAKEHVGKVKEESLVATLAQDSLAASGCTL